MSCGDTFMHVQNTITYLLIYLIVQSLSQLTKAGVCWESIDDAYGTCRGPFLGNMTYKDCCAISDRASVSWSNHSRNSDVFFQAFLSERGASGCHRCHKSCETVKCRPDRVCRTIDGLPKCVCRPKCDKSLKTLGPVCGSDGRKYKSYCALLRTNCKQQRAVALEYFGRCRRSCKNVRCKQGQHCLADQNGHPHCWACETTCKRFIPDEPRNYFCAVDGKTYKNTCELKAEICRVGHSITFAYSGMCKENSTCLTTTCPRRATCLKNPKNGQPVCTDCSNIDAHCTVSNQLPLCGTDGRTYPNYCGLRKLSCENGIFVTTKRAGRCKTRKRVSVKKKNRRKNARKRKINKKIRKEKVAWKKRKQRQRKKKQNKHKKKYLKKVDQHIYVKGKIKQSRSFTHFLNRNKNRTFHQQERANQSNINKSYNKPHEE